MEKVTVLKRFTCFLVVMLMVIGLASGCGVRTETPKTDPQQTPPQQTPPQQTKDQSGSNTGKPSADNPAGKKASLTLYFGNDQADAVVPEAREVLVSDDKTLPEVIINELIKGPQNPRLHRTVPVETRLLSVKIEKGIAYADFSKEMQTKNNVGSAGEFITTYSVVNSLTELPGCHLGPRNYKRAHQTQRRCYKKVEN
ncbi:MAG: GerMN domain-containing protein [Eubacteriales bacterium]